MPRDIPVGNGRLLVCFDSEYQIRDVFYPHAGLENQAGRQPCKTGVYVDGKMSWIGPDWHKTLKYTNSLVTDVTARNDSLGIEVHFSDCVDYVEPIFMREVRVKDLTGDDREVKVFFFHDLNLYENTERDTAFYDPKSRSVIHYKDRRYCLICASTPEAFGVDDFAMGDKNTWKDADDGHLSRNASATGNCASIIGVHMHLPPNGEKTCHQWLLFGLNYTEARSYNNFVWDITPHELMRRTHNYWLLWTHRHELRLDTLPDYVRQAFHNSLLILRTQTDIDGGILSGTDTDHKHFDGDDYTFVRPREAAKAAMAFDKAGLPDISMDFYSFCAASATEDGFLLPRYFPSGSAGSIKYPWMRDGNPALPIHEDDTALVLLAMWRHFDRYRDLDFVEPLYDPFVLCTAEFLARYVDEDTHLPLDSYDIWDQGYGVHTHTVCAVIAGLWSAAKFAKAFGDDLQAKRFNQVADEMKSALVKTMYNPDAGRFARSAYKKEHAYELDMTIDSSLYALFAFGIFATTDEHVVSTMNQVKERLWIKSDVGGFARFENDRHMRLDDNLTGNPWLQCTLWMAQYDIQKAQNVDELDTANFLIEYACKSALPSKALPEQLHPHTCAPIAARPATSVHAELINTIMMLLEKQEQLQPERRIHRSIYEEMHVYAMENLPEKAEREPVPELAEIT